MPTTTTACTRCRNEPPADAPYRDTYLGGEGDEYVICPDCVICYSRCPSCTRRVTYLENIFTGAYSTSDHIMRCYQCAQEDYYQCPSCEDWYSTLQESGECVNCDNYVPEYDDDEYDSRLIHDYSYRPALTFYSSTGERLYARSTPEDDTPSRRTPAPNIPYLGMELEISIDQLNDGARILTDAAPNFLYCKQDSSVDGFEAVTHPATLAAHTELIPFDTLRTLRKEYDASAYKNGIHVHVARSGFTDDLHVFRWLKLIYRNEGAISRIARRKNSNWARFDNGMRSLHKQIKKNSTPYRSDRYSAVNVLNSTTFEVRIFRGSLLRQEILAALQLVHATVEYSRRLTTKDILQNNGWSYSRFIQYAAEQTNTDGTPLYAELIAEDAKTTEEEHYNEQERKRQEEKYKQEQLERISRQRQRDQERADALRNGTSQYHELNEIAVYDPVRDAFIFPGINPVPREVIDDYFWHRTSESLRPEDVNFPVLIDGLSQYLQYPRETCLYLPAQSRCSVCTILSEELERRRREERRRRLPRASASFSGSGIAYNPIYTNGLTGADF